MPFEHDTLCASGDGTFNGTAVEQRSAERPAFVHVNCDKHRIVDGERVSVLQEQRQRCGRARHNRHDVVVVAKQYASH
jgi:hypothetical protein